MGRHEIIDLIHLIESSIDINKISVRGVNIWPLFRIFIAENLYKDELIKVEKKNQIKENKVTKTNSMIKRIYADFLTSKSQSYQIKKQAIDVVFLTHTTCRQYLKGCDWYDIFCDPYRDIFESKGFKTISLEMCPRQEYRLPTYNPSIFIQNKLNYGSIKSKILNFFGILVDDSLVYEINNIKEIIQRLHGDKNNFLTIKTVNYLLLKLFWLADYFQDMLIRLMPSVAFTVAYYSLEGMAFNLACRRQNILSIDIQHGVQGQLHCAYATWTNIPYKDYDLLPSKFWCWTRADKDNISTWTSSESPFHKPIEGGNLWLELWRNKDNSVVEVYDQIVLKTKNKYKNKRHFLFTAQPVKDIFPDWFLSTIRASKAYAHWWLRLHPSMIKNKESIQNKLNSHGIENFELAQATDIPLYAILRHMEIHITQWSSAVLEANEFNIPSILIHRNGQDFFSEEIRTGRARLACNQEELISLIQDKNFLSLAIHSDLSTFFTSNEAIQNICNYMKSR